MDVGNIKIIKVFDKQERIVCSHENPNRDLPMSLQKVMRVIKIIRIENFRDESVIESHDN